MPILILVAACVVLVIAMTGSYGAGKQRGRADGWDMAQAMLDEEYDRGYRDGKPRHDSKTGRFTKR